MNLLRSLLVIFVFYKYPCLLNVHGLPLINQNWGIDFFCQIKLQTFLAITYN